MRVYINDIDRTSTVIRNSISIDESGQERSKIAEFEAKDVENYPVDHALYVPFNDGGYGSYALDKSGNSLHALLTNVDYAIAEILSPVTGGNEIAGTAGVFDGASGNATVTDNVAIQNIFDGGGGFTIWVKPSSDGEGNEARIVDKGGASTGWTAHVLSEAAGFVKIRFIKIFSTTSGQWTTTTAVLPINVWSEVGVFYDADSIVNDPTIEINGVSQTLTEDATPVGTRSSDVGINIILGNQETDARTWDGNMRELKIWTRILTAAERTAIKNYPQGFTPVTQYKQVRIYEAFQILARDGTTVTLDYDYFLNQATGILRVNDDLYIDIGLGTETKKTISSISLNANDKIVLTVTPSGSDGFVDAYAGIKLFAGSILDIRDRNIGILSNLQYEVSCAGQERLFDKKNVNDTWEDRTARYMINQACNVDINLNQLIDDFEYANNAAIQAAWIESGDGGNPTIDTTNYRESTTSGILPWTFSAGTATFSLAFTAVDISNFTGRSSGHPVKGSIGLHVLPNNFSNITSLALRIGSDSSNYTTVTFTLDDNNWDFPTKKLAEGTTTGTPNWAACDYCAIIITETATGQINVDGIRILEDEHFKHFPNVLDSTPVKEFDDFRAARLKPTEFLQRLAEALGWYWRIDDDRFIHFFPSDTNNAPFDLSETSNNFSNLRINYDVSRLVNRQVVRGGEETSASQYWEHKEGEGHVREWNTKNKFVSLEVFEDRSTSSHTAEATTTTTTIKITTHGLAVGDYITNRTRSNAVRKVLTVPSADTFTVDTVTGQVAGDTITFFVEMTVGVDGINTADESSYAYMRGAPEVKSIRASSVTTTLVAGQFIMFRYFEKFDIAVQRRSGTSITAMKNIIGHTDGIFDGQVIHDQTINSQQMAASVADAQIRKYGNMVITAQFSTRENGLKVGQLIQIQDTTSSTRDLNQAFVIQRVRLRQFEEGENRYDITAATLLFGIMELLQQLLRNDRNLRINEDEIIYNIMDEYEIIEITDTVSAIANDNLQEENIKVTDAIVLLVQTAPFKYGPGGVPQGVYQLSEYA